VHETAYNNCQNFYNKYLKDIITDSSLVLDFGSCDVNGSLKPIFNACKYIGLDAANGPNVDIVCNANNVPFKNDSVEVVVSSSCFEHDMFFWESFLEMCRVCKPQGYIYINVPSAACYHPYPIDCWRFYLDSWLALQAYSIRKGYNIELLERYIDQSYADRDCVGIFKKL
jgi:ubiquinone/menaquinone biosynthesis C-methylase UbiE